LPDGKTHVQVSFSDASPLFLASAAQHPDGTLNSSVVVPVADFAAVIKGGVAMNGRSLHPDRRTKVDPFKEDTSCEPLYAAIDASAQHLAPPLGGLFFRAPGLWLIYPERLPRGQRRANPVAAVATATAMASTF